MRSRYEVICFFQCSRLTQAQEGTEGVITLKAADAAADNEESCDDPDMVKMMVDYFYHQDYLTDQTVTFAALASESNEEDNQNPECDDFDNSYGYKKKYLKLKKKSRYSELSTSPPPASISDPAVDACVLEHAKVFALAVKYQVPALKILATNKFQAAINVAWAHPSLAQVITTVYSSTPDDVAELRDIVAVALTKRKSLLERPEIEVAVCNINTLAYRLLKMRD